MTIRMLRGPRARICRAAPGFLLAFVLALTVGTVASAKALFVYVHDRGSPNRIHGFGLDKKTGELSQLACSPFDTLDPVAAVFRGHFQTLAYAKKPKLLLSTGPNGVTAWQVGTDGCLALVAGSPFTAAGPSEYLGVATSKRGAESYVYVAEWPPEPGLIHGFRVGEAGALEALASSPVAADLGTVGLVAAKGVLAAMNFCSASLSTWRIQKDGSLIPAPGSPLVHGDLDDDGEIGACQGSPQLDVYSLQLSLDQKGRRLYTGDLNGPRLFGFRVDRASAGLAPFPGNPRSLDLTDTGLGIAVTKGKLVLGVSALGGVQPLKRTKEGVELLGPPQALTIPGPTAFALSEPQRQLVVAGSGLLAVFGVDKKTGSLATNEAGEVEPLDARALAAPDATAVLIVKR